MIENPFEVIENRLSGIEALLIEIKHRPITVDEPADRINFVEACKITGQSKGQVYRLTMLGEIPHQKFGKRLVFSRKELIAWMEARTIPAPEAGGVMTDLLAKSARKHLRK